MDKALIETVALTIAQFFGPNDTPEDAAKAAITAVGEYCAGLAEDACINATIERTHDECCAAFGEGIASAIRTATSGDPA